MRLTKGKKRVVKQQKLSNVNKINIKIGLPSKLGILGNAVGNFDNIKKASGSSNRLYGNQMRYSSQQAHYGMPNVRYIQAIPNIATISVPRSDLAGTGVSDIEGLSNDQHIRRELTNPADLSPQRNVKQFVHGYAAVEDPLKIYNNVRVEHPKVHAEPQFSSIQHSKANDMVPRPGTLAPSTMIPRLSSSSVGTFAEIGTRPYDQAQGKYEKLDRSDSMADPQRLDNAPWGKEDLQAKSYYSDEHKHSVPTGSPAIPYPKKEKPSEKELLIKQQLSPEAQRFKQHFNATVPLGFRSGKKKVGS
jgi:hypothetical protein